jgi:Flp pilus assembly protein protease CpaA
MHYWALWIACLLLVVSCIINVWYPGKIVPNWLSLSSLVVGLLVGLALVGPGIVPSAGGGFYSSLCAAIVGFVLLLPLYLRGWMGAGSVKMQMAFGAWAGCALPFGRAILLMSVSGAASIVAIIGVFFIYERVGQNQAVHAGGGPRLKLAPAQPLLTVASVGCVLILLFLGSV